MDLGHALRELRPSKSFDETRPSFTKMSTDEVKQGLVKAGAPSDLLQSIENFLFGTKTQLDIWGRLPARIDAIQAAYVTARDKVIDFTKTIEETQSRLTDLLEGFSVSQSQNLEVDIPTKAIDGHTSSTIVELSCLGVYEEALEILQEQWVHVTALLKNNDPLTKPAKGAEVKDIGEANLQYTIDQLQQVIDSKDLNDCLNAISRLSDMDDDLERERSALENDYETRRLDNYALMLKHCSKGPANCHGKALRDYWKTWKTCCSLTSPILFFVIDIGHRHRDNDSSEVIFKPIYTAYDQVKKATVTGHAVIFPEAEASIAPVIKLINTYLSDQDRNEVARASLMLLQQVAISKALAELYQDEETIAKLYPQCRDFGSWLEGTIKHARFIRSALCELQHVLAIKLNPQLQGFLTTIADLYRSIQIEDTEEIAFALQEWRNKGVMVKDAGYGLQGLTGPCYPPVPRSAREGSHFLHGVGTTTGTPPAGLDTNNVLWGLSRYDVEPHKNFRVGTEFRNGNPTVWTWCDSQVVHARISYIEVPQHPSLQHGYGSTDGRDMYLHHGPGDKFWDFPVTFSPKYDKIPNVVCWLTLIDAHNGANLRIDSYAMDVTNEGCTIRIKTWSNSSLNKFCFGWLAHPQDDPTVYATTQAFQKRGRFGGGGSTRDETNAGKIVHFPGAMQRQRAPPIVAAFVKGFDNDSDKYHRLDASADKITKQKMTARATSWSDTNMYYGGGTYIAVAME